MFWNRPISRDFTDTLKGHVRAPWSISLTPAKRSRSFRRRRKSSTPKAASSIRGSAWAIDFDRSALGLDDMIRQISALRTCTSEKGTKLSALPTGRAGNSTFDWIDRNVADLLPDAELVLCDDGRNECCDFLLAGPRAGRETVIMVHAKASDGSFISAGALHEFCAQAAKQIGTIGQFNPVEPKQVGLLSGPWEGPGGEGTVRL